MRAAFIGLWLGLASVASADAIDSAPETCPRGAVPESSHAGPHCAAAPACTDGGCRAPARCEDVAVCILDVPRGGMLAEVRSSRGDPPLYEPHVVGTCEDGVCAQGSCVRSRACIAPSPAPSPPPSSAPPSSPSPSSPPTAAPTEAPSAGCAAGVATRSGLAWLAVLALLVWRRAQPSV